MPRPSRKTRTSASRTSAPTGVGGLTAPALFFFVGVSRERILEENEICHMSPAHPTFEVALILRSACWRDRANSADRRCRQKAHSIQKLRLPVFGSLLTCRALCELVERGVKCLTPERILQRDLSAYIGHVFEDVSRQWLYIILLGAHCRFRSTEMRAQGNRRVPAFAFHQTAGADYR